MYINIKTPEGLDLIVGNTYEVYSPLNNPWQFLTKDVLEIYGKDIKHDLSYSGRLEQMPTINQDNGSIEGTNLIFTVIGTNYPMTISEPVKFILEGITAIREVS